MLILCILLTDKLLFLVLSLAFTHSSEETHIERAVAVKTKLLLAMKGLLALGKAAID